MSWKPTSCWLCFRSGKPCHTLPSTWPYRTQQGGMGVVWQDRAVCPGVSADLKVQSRSPCYHRTCMTSWCNVCDHDFVKVWLSLPALAPNHTEISVFMKGLRHSSSADSELFSLHNAGLVYSPVMWPVICPLSFALSFLFIHVLLATLQSPPETLSPSLLSGPRGPAFSFPA